MKNKTEIRITDTRTPKQLEAYLSKVCLMRTARKNGDSETVSNTVLGLLNQHQIKFEKI